MVNPGAFQGLRKEFLMNEKPAYARGVEGNYAADALATIQCRYFKRFPIDLPHDQDPTADFLARINENSPDPEPIQPDPDKMSAEEYVLAMKKIEERKQSIIKRKAQIKRWLAYQYSKDHDLNPKESGSRNPYRILIHQLTGVGVKKPRQRSAANTWRKTQTDIINAETRRIAKLADTPKNELTALRDKIARNMFEKLPKEEHDEWEAEAKNDHQELLTKWEEDMKGPPSSEPADRQRCIQGLAGFAKPILDLICEATGWKASLIAGGPEPAHDGRLNVISIHSGTTTGDFKMNFGKAERAVYKKYILPAFGSFLQKCYSVEECLARALPQEEGFEPLAGMETSEDQGVFIDTYEASPVPNASRSQTPIISNANSLGSDSHLRLTGPKNRSCSQESIASTASKKPKKRDITVIDTTQSLVLPLAEYNTPDVTTTCIPASPQRVESITPPLSPRSPVTALPSCLPPTRTLNSMLPIPQDSVEAAIPASHAVYVTKESLNTKSILEPPTQSSAASSPHIPSSELANETVSAVACAISQAASSEHFPHVSGTSSATVPAPTLDQPLKRKHITHEHHPPLKRHCTDLSTSASHSSTRITRSKSKNTSAPDRRISLPTILPDSNGEQLTNLRDHGLQVPIDPQASPWFTSAFSMFNTSELGNEWINLVSEWAKFERLNNYKDLGRISARDRPLVVNDWIHRSRPTLDTWRPIIEDTAKVGEEFMKWWTSMQPPWRLSRNGKITKKCVVGDLQALRKSGPNGMLSVVAGLFYWGRAVSTQKARLTKWNVAVADCRFVFKTLNSQLSAE